MFFIAMIRFYADYNFVRGISYLISRYLISQECFNLLKPTGYEMHQQV